MVKCEPTHLSPNAGNSRTVVKCEPTHLLASSTWVPATASTLSPDAGKGNDVSSIQSKSTLDEMHMEMYCQKHTHST